MALPVNDREHSDVAAQDVEDRQPTVEHSALSEAQRTSQKRQENVKARRWGKGCKRLCTERDTALTNMTSQ